MAATQYPLVRTAVVGVGLMGALFAHLLQQSPRGQLVALAEADRSRHPRLNADYGVPVYEDCVTLLDAVPLDAVVVATSDQAHREPALTVLRRGLALFIEKPLALTLFDAEQILAADGAGSPLMVGQVLRFDPRFILLREAVTRGELGTVQLIHGRREAPLAEGQRLGGRTSLAFYLSVHDIDAIHWITGARVAQVSAAYHGRVSGILQETGALLAATLWLDTGAVATLQHAWTLPDSTYRLHQQLFEVIGTAGTARLDALDDGLRLETESRVAHPSAHYIFTPVLHGRISGVYRDELEHFLECVQTGARPVVTGADGVAAVAVAAAIDQAARAGRPCPVRYPDAAR